MEPIHQVCQSGQHLIGLVFLSQVNNEREVMTVK